MIEINLIPGAKKAKRSKGASIDFGAVFSDLTARIRDPWLISAAVGLAVGIGAVAFLYLKTGAKEKALADRQEKAVQDSTRYAAVIAQRNLAEAQRDSVIRQIAIIKAIDGTRFIWPHVLDEISNALTPYTWLKTLQQTSAVPAVGPEIETGVTDATKARNRLAAAADSAEVASAGITIRLVGQTVDVQAYTKFAQNLSASPWFENVVMSRTETVIAQPTNKEVYEFTLDFRVKKPDSKQIRMVPLTIQVR